MSRASGRNSNKPSSPGNQIGPRQYTGAATHCQRRAVECSPWRKLGKGNPMWASRVIEVGRSEHAQPAEPQSYTHPIRSRGEARSPLYRATIALLFALSPLASAAPDVSTTGDANPAIPATSNPVDLTGTSL